MIIRILPLLVLCTTGLVSVAQNPAAKLVVTLNGTPRDTLSVSEIDTTTEVGLVQVHADKSRTECPIASFVWILPKEQGGLFYTNQGSIFNLVTVQHLQKLKPGDKFYLNQINYWADKEQRPPLQYVPTKLIVLK